MMPFLDKFGMVGSAGQSPVAFPCSFAVSLPVTASILQTGGGATSAPGAPDLLAASDSGASATDNVTSDTTPAFRVGLPVEAIAGDTVRIYRAGSTEIGSAALDAGDVTAGFVDVTAAALSAGGHSITARVENGAGLSPASAGLAIAVDTAAPDAPTAIVVAPADQGSGTLQTDDTQPTFRISLPANAVAGDVATLEVDAVDDATAALIAGDITNGYVDIQSASVLADDALYDISAFITDVAGNQGASSGAVEVEVGDASGNAIPAVVYDGVQGYMLHTGGPTGAADGAALTVAWAGTFNSDGSAMTLLDIPGSVPVKLTRNADNTIGFVGGTAGAVFSNVTSAVAASLGFLIVLASCDGTASVLKVVHAAGTITGTNTPGAAASLDLTADWFLGSDGGAAEFVDADTALWWIDGQHIDFAAADNIEQFWDTTGDTLRDPGADGSNPLDGASSPLVCHKSSAASHTTNVGTGGNADTAGVFADGVSPGSYAGDYFPASSIPAVVFGSSHLSGNNRHDSDVSFGIIAFWFRRTTLGTVQYMQEASTASRGRLVWFSNNHLHFLLTNNSGNAVIGAGFNSPQQITTSLVADTNWHHLIMSWDTQAVSTGSWKVYLDGVDQSAGIGGSADGTAADLNRDDVLGASAAGASRFQGEVAQFYMNFNHSSYFDLTVEANRDKFYDSANHRPRDLGVDGTATGLAQPDHLLDTAAASYGTNAGTGGNWTVNGSFSDAAAGPGPASPQS